MNHHLHDDARLTSTPNARGRKLLDDFCAESGILGQLSKFFNDKLPPHGPVIVVGGFIRDVFRGPRIQPRDIDVVIDNIEKSSLQALPGARLNFFGGTTLSYGNLSVDVWPLEDTFHIREFRLEPSIESFLAGAPFNLDKIALDIRAAKLYDRGCLDGIHTGTIEYDPANPYLEHVQAVRAVLLLRKTQFTLAPSAVDMLCRAAILLRDNRECVRQACDYLFRLKQVESEAACMAIVEEVFVAAGEASRSPHRSPR